jgi:16S rRNA (guanine(966)-N(2))-methyltransferase RsmD
MKIGLEIQGGERKGAKIRVPRGIRPTQSLVKRSIFDRLGDWIADKRVLELFAGSGAVGFEALSRGATDVLFVDRSRDAVLSIRENAKKLLYADRIEAVKSESLRALRKLVDAGRRFELVFADPPYDSVRVEQVLELAPMVLDEGGMLIVQTRKNQNVPASDGLVLEKEAKFGDTKVSFYRRLSR